MDSQENRADIKRLRGVIKGKVTTIKATLKASKKNVTSQNKIMLERQTAQLDSQITKFQGLLEKEKTAVKQHPVPTNSSKGMLLGLLCIDSFVYNDRNLSPNKLAAIERGLYSL